MSDWIDAEAHADRALEMYERGRWAEAEAELRKALSLHPDRPEWLFNLGLTLEAAGRDADSLGCYERAIELMPQEIEPLVAAGVMSNRLGQFQKAIEYLDRALKQNPSVEAAYAHKIDSHVRLGQHDEAETTFYLAQHALEEPSAQCHAVMAESLLQQQQFDRAEWCLKEAMRLEPNMPRVRARLAAISAATGKTQRALQLYLRELRDDPGNIDTLLECGDLLREIGRLPEAGEKFRRVLELEPANVEAHFGLGLIAMSSGRFDQAHVEFELVMKLEPEFPGVRAAMADALLRSGQHAEARQHLNDEYELLAHAPQQANAGDGSAELAVDSPAVRHARLAHLADLLLEAGEPVKAVELLERVIREQGETADLLRMLALGRYRSGDHDGGAAASRRVLRLDPNCIRSVHNLALAALRRGQVRMAAGWIKRGLKLNRNDEGLRRLRMRLWVARLKQVWRFFGLPRAM